MEDKMSKKSAAIPIIALLIVFSNSEAQNIEHSTKNFWENGTFHQETVDLSKSDAGIIHARVDGDWQDFEIIELPDDFMNWNIVLRKTTIENIKQGKMPGLAGPHNAMVASHGIKRNDSNVMINNAVKGMGFIPKKERLTKVIDNLKSTIEKSTEEKLDILIGMYNEGDKLFDRTKQISLELYATPEFETGTFLNQMANPAVAIVFLDMKSFELKAIAQMLHPDDPKLSDYEKQVVEYANLIHSYFHGEFDRMFIAVVYHVIEIYDNSPGKGGKGARIH